VENAVPARLTLTLLARGASQQVYVLAGASDHPWVYKTPAIVEALLLTPVTWRSIKPVTPWKRRVYELFVERPAELWNDRADAVHDTGAAHARLMRAIAVRSAMIANRLSSAWARAARRRRFRRMCRILRRIADEGLHHAVLPFEILEAACTLHADGRITHYRGPVLRQRRADFFFEYFDALDRFDWGAPARVQHELWRHGIGLVDADEALGPRNWSLLDGEVLLADTGSLTEDLNEVRGVLSEERLNDREREIPTWWPNNVSSSLPQYFAHVRRAINREQLDRLWRTT
jgi:hypothetical protein